MKIGDAAKVGERIIDCTEYQKGTQRQKISRYPFPEATEPLEGVSIDIAGKMRIPDCTWNYKFLLVIINHHTRYTWVFALISKDMAIQALKIFIASVERQSGSLLAVLQTDNAQEFVAKK